MMNLRICHRFRDEVFNIFLTFYYYLAIESCFGMYQGEMGMELQAMDSMHKFVWSNVSCKF